MALLFCGIFYSVKWLIENDQEHLKYHNISIQFCRCFKLFYYQSNFTVKRCYYVTVADRQLYKRVTFIILYKSVKLIM